MSIQRQTMPLTTAGIAQGSKIATLRILAPANASLRSSAASSPKIITDGTAIAMNAAVDTSDEVR